ncbi:small capsid protein [Elephant endotheliotropic herpesvirus 6]|nr:small capsid protein [Elephant endotheliotropic herpesvirus 6]
MSNNPAAQQAAPAAQVGRGQRSVQQDRTEEERKLQFLRRFNLDQQNLLQHPAIVMFKEKYYQRRQPFSATEETALRLELLRLFSNIRQNT